MKINVNVSGQTTTFEINGELDIGTVDFFKANLLNEETGEKVVFIDFSGVRFVDSTGVGGLIEVLRTFHSKMLDVSISNIDPNVYEIFELLGLPELFAEVEFLEKIESR